MTLQELIQAHDEGRVPEHAVVITFDDGYRDFAELAFPIMQELDIPVTLFVTTGFVSGELWLWPDQLRYALSKTEVCKIELVGLQGELEIQKQPVRCWHRIADYCMTLPNNEKLRLIDELYSRLGIVKPRYAPDNYRALSWKQIRDMVGRGLEVGSHSYSHPILTHLDDDELDIELNSSKAHIERELGITAMAFCYPNGQPVDFDDRVQAAVRAAGYSYAITAYPGKKPLSDRWALNRYSVNNSFDIFERTVYGMTYLKSQ